MQLDHRTNSYTAYLAAAQTQIRRLSIGGLNPTHAWGQWRATHAGTARQPHAGDTPGRHCAPHKGTAGTATASRAATQCQGFPSLHAAPTAPPTRAQIAQTCRAATCQASPSTYICSALQRRLGHAHAHSTVDTCQPMHPPALAQLLQRRLAQQESQRGQAVPQHDGQADPQDPPSCAGLPVADAAWRPALASSKGAQDAVACSMHDMLQSMVSGTLTCWHHVLCLSTP